MTRRQLLGCGVVALAAAACSDGGGDAADPSASSQQAAPTSSATMPGAASTTTAALSAADFAGLGVCRLLPEQTAGPFPLDDQFDRRDITEGVAGRPMRLGLRVVDEGCEPVPGAAVEIWHCDASGDYSAFTDRGGGKDEGKDSTFLRGTQTAGADGIAEFLSIVPGWYAGRAVHVHLRVHLDGGLVLTSQMYFDPAHLAGVYGSEPYLEFGPPDTSNEDDAIAGDPAAEGTLLHTVAAPTSAGPGTLALLNLGVQPTASG